MQTQYQDHDFLSFIKNIKNSTAIDLSYYKETQMKRRLTTLRDKHGFSTFQIYYDAMVLNKVLFNEFLERMTINVSEFWRNPIRWEILQNEIIPNMKDFRKGLKCWSAACSSGEEPYSLAMVLAEQNLLSKSTIKASDIDNEVLSKAKQGVYIDRSIQDLPEPYLKKYLIQDRMTHRVVDILKDAVEFEKMNLLHDSFESDFDLIICRNVMIYFTDEAKKILFQKFSDALKPGGVLFVGSTEQIFSPQQYNFELLGSFFYKKKLN